MEVLTGGAAVIILDEGEAAALARQLAEAIKLGYVARGRQPPRFLLDVARGVRGAARFHANVQVSTDLGTGEFQDDLALRLSEQPVRLSIREAAQLAEVSEGYLRRVIRRGDVEASRGHRGAWGVDIASLAAWISQRRKGDQRRTVA